MSTQDTEASDGLPFRLAHHIHLNEKVKFPKKLKKQFRSLSGKIAPTAEQWLKIMEQVAELFKIPKDEISRGKEPLKKLETLVQKLLIIKKKKIRKGVTVVFLTDPNKIGEVSGIQMNYLISIKGMSGSFHPNNLKVLKKK
jgi:hypothetical protein